MHLFRLCSEFRACRTACEIILHHCTASYCICTHVQQDTACGAWYSCWKQVWSTVFYSLFADKAPDACRKNIMNWSFQEATVHKKVEDAYCNAMINGQQRIISIVVFLAVLRHVAIVRHDLSHEQVSNSIPSDIFQFATSTDIMGPRQMEPRVKVRRLQLPFWSKYISSEQSAIGALWDASGKPMYELAGRDTIKKRLIEVATAFKEVMLYNLCL